VGSYPSMFGGGPGPWADEPWNGLQLPTSDAEWVVRILVGAGGEAVERNRIAVSDHVSSDGARRKNSSVAKAKFQRWTE
jgi:hypothetical protein